MPIWFHVPTLLFCSRSSSFFRLEGPNRNHAIVFHHVADILNFFVLLFLLIVYSAVPFLLTELKQVES